MWFIISLILGAGLLALALWLRSRGIVVKWYEWLIAAVGLGMLVFAVQIFITSPGELETQAGWMHMLIFGAPALILLAVVGFLAQRRHSAGPVRLLQLHKQPMHRLSRGVFSQMTRVTRIICSMYWYRRRSSTGSRSEFMKS